MKFYIVKNDYGRIFVELRDKKGEFLMVSSACADKNKALSICEKINARTDMDIEIVDETEEGKL